MSPDDAHGRTSDQEGATPMEEQALTAATEPEHDRADEHELPHESLSPITLAAGVALLAFGLLTSPIFSIVGIVTMAWALASWIKEIQHG